uniref:NADH-ubiquinone oxidoreductase chain 4 n=1 Tax=Anaspidinae sp. GENSP01 TaxID=1205605 RepID=A0A0S2MQF4_9CUCU|nr:NADH deshydrogenase subunit 4 [Anaspidinae sp. GENSP01]
MVKILFFLIFLIPLTKKNEFWFILWMFFLSLFLYLKDFSFSVEFINLFMGLGSDLMSFFMVLLSLWICSLMIMASEKIYFMNNMSNFFLFVMIILLISLLLLFSSLNLFVFYLFFEISLIPTLILISIYDYQGHVEAPVAGSMILAGIMLKMGGYGLLRVMLMFIKLGVKFNLYFMSLTLVGGFIVSLICIIQSDMKSLIAYSSVAHMGLALGGILSLNYWGFQGCLVMMIAHGLCSSGLFSIANISYERVMSRSLYLNKGLINLFPSLSLWWFLLLSSSMAAPPSLNLLSEIMLINSIMSYFNMNMIFLMLISFFSAVYSLYLFSFSQHGKFNIFYCMNMGYYREYLMLMLHWLPLNILILKWDLLMI